LGQQGQLRAGKPLWFVRDEKMKMLSTIVRQTSSITAVVVLAGCATQQTVVEPIPPQTPISEICILVNPAVRVPGFVTLVQEGISRHGLRSTTFGEVPSSCVYVLEYVALSTWLGQPTPSTTTLGRADIRMYSNKKLIGSVNYVIPREVRRTDGSADNSARFSSMKEKLDPLMDELLKNFPSSKGQ